MRVADYFEIDEEELFNKLDNLTEEGQYWKRAFEFYHKLKEKDLTDLSDAHMQWLGKIKMDLGIENGR